jgi:hypothetical protein
VVAVARERARSFTWPAILCVFLVGVPKTGSAQDFAFEYRSEWRRFGALDYAATAGVLAAYLIGAHHVMGSSTAGAHRMPWFDPPAPPDALGLTLRVDG